MPIPPHLPQMHYGYDDGFNTIAFSRPFPLTELIILFFKAINPWWKATIGLLRISCHKDSVFQ